MASSPKRTPAPGTPCIRVSSNSPNWYMLKRSSRSPAEPGPVDVDFLKRAEIEVLRQADLVAPVAGVGRVEGRPVRAPGVPAGARNAPPQALNE